MWPSVVVLSTSWKLPQNFPGSENASAGLSSPATQTPEAECRCRGTGRGGTGRGASADAGPRAEGPPRPGTRGLQCAHRRRLLGARPQAGLEAPEGKDVEAPVSLRARPRPGVRPPGPGWHADLPPHGPAGSRRKRAP